MHLICMGLNHKTADIGLREKLTLNPELVIETIREIRHSAHVNAVVLLSTCNRTEIYLEASSLPAVLRWLKRQYKLSLDDLREYSYLYLDQEAVQHLMQVACGLDSMVLGEGQILGQLKTAYQLSVQHGSVSKSLSKLFQNVFSVAKKVRTQTDIGVNPVSVAYLAVRLVERIFAHISEQTVLLIGAGDTSRLLVKHLCSAGVKQFYIANRTLARSQELAQEIYKAKENGEQSSVEFIELGMLPEYLARADIVVAATAAPLPIVGKGMVEHAVKTRKYKPMFMIDLSVPRNIEPQVREISEVYLYGIDDLQTIAAEHKRCRHSAAQQAELIIRDEAAKFMGWLESQHAISTIQAFRQSCEIQRDQALNEALRQLQSGKDPAAVLERLAHVLLNRLIHQPTVQMRDASVSGDADFLVVVRRLFKIRAEQETTEESLNNL